MELRVYYQKIRNVESGIQDEFPVVVSRETSDGGVAGVRSQVTRGLAARLVVEEKATLATPEETQEFLAEQAAAWRAATEDEDALTPKKPAPTRSRTPKKS
jgi:hypothetical protein